MKILVKIKKSCEKGIIIPTVLMFMIVSTLTGMALMTKAQMEFQLFWNKYSTRQAFYTAQSGVAVSQAILGAHGEWLDFTNAGNVDGESLKTVNDTDSSTPNKLSSFYTGADASESAELAKMWFELTFDPYIVGEAQYSSGDDEMTVRILGLYPNDTGDESQILVKIKRI